METGLANDRRPIVALTARLPGDAVPGLGRRLLVDRTGDGWWYAMGSAGETTLAYCTDPDLWPRTATASCRTWRDLCRGVEWVPSTVAAVRPAVRSRMLGRSRPPADTAIRAAGDAADPLSGTA